jgi:NADH-quinone oxidoreductase subunit M
MPKMSRFPIITTLTFMTLLGALIVAGVGPENRKLARNLALGFSFIALFLALTMWRTFDSSSGAFQFEELHRWIPSLGIQYRVAVDGLGLLMVLLTAIVTPMAMLASGNLFAFAPTLPQPAGENDPAGARAGAGHSAGAGHRPHLYYALMLLLQGGLFGTFTALNFFHWFLFWELSLIPAFFLIRLWGGSRRAAAATRFFVYTMAGSIALLLTFLAIFVATDQVSDFTVLAEWARQGKLIPALGARLGWYSLSVRALAVVLFLGPLLGFAVKVPLMPFHTWLPSAYAEAPTGTTMLLTGVMSKMGVYGFLRILLPIFPEPTLWLRTPLLALAVVTIVFSAGAAFAQTDLKRILAYSSINHLGYCLLGLFAIATPAIGVTAPATERAAALNGLFLQLFNHGLTAATLFWFVSLMEQRSGGLRGLNDFGGLRRVAPVFCGLMGIALFSALGLPGLNGFVGEFLIFKGAFPLATCSTSLSLIGLLVTAIFILTILQRVFNGPLNEKWSQLPDLTWAERARLAIPIGLMFVLGVFPQLVLGVVNSTVVQMVKQLPF